MAGGLYRSATETDRYRLRVRAVLASRPSDDLASHHAALALLGLPLWRVDLRRIDVVSDVTASTSHNGLVVHPRDGPWLTGREGAHRAVPVARALLETAASGHVQGGVVAADAALSQGGCLVEDLRRLLDAAPPWNGRRRAAAMVRLVDPRSESVGESRLRLLMVGAGLSVRSQVRVVDNGGFVVARVDFLVGDRVVVEFDGAVKYAGDASGRTLFDEKRREDRLRELGFEVVRVTWSDLGHPERVLARIGAALARVAARPA